MFGALLARDLSAIGSPFQVSSAGLLDWDEPADPDAARAMVAFGIDLSEHRSRPVADLDLSSFDLILTMTREHVRELVIREPDLLPVTFTAKSFARTLAAPRENALVGDVAERVRSLSADRPLAAMLGMSPDDDVADPYRLGQEAFNTIAEELSGLSRVISFGMRDLVD